MAKNVKKGFKRNTGLVIIVFGIILIVGGFIYATFKTDLFKNKEEPIEDNDNDKKNDTNEIAIGIAENFEGIYMASNDKVYIHKKNNNELSYVIADTFQGTAKIIDENTAREEKKP